LYNDISKISKLLQQVGRYRRLVWLQMLPLDNPLRPPPLLPLRLLLKPQQWESMLPA
jgi:hypothetical protein